MSGSRRTRVWKDDAGEWRWTFSVSSDKVATSGEGYANRAHAVKQALSLFPGVALEVQSDDGTWAVITEGDA